MSQFLAPIMPEHPVFDYPKGEHADKFLQKFGPSGWNAMMQSRNDRITLELEKPYYGRVQMPIWHVADFITGAITWDEFASNKKHNQHKHSKRNIQCHYNFSIII